MEKKTMNNDSVSELTATIPVGSIVLSTSGRKVVSEYTRRKESVTASVVCISSACDGHYDGLLPINVPEAGQDTVYTKRFIRLKDPPQQFHAHMDGQQFHDFVCAAANDSIPKVSGKTLILGGISYQGLALATLTHLVRRQGDLEFLLIESLYSPEEIGEVKAYLDGLSIHVRGVELSGEVSDRGSYLALVKMALAQVREDFDQVFDPHSSTLSLAVRLAGERGYAVDELSGVERCLTNLTHKEIETFSRISLPIPLQGAIDSAVSRASGSIQPSILDAVMLAAHALQTYLPEY